MFSPLYIAIVLELPSEISAPAPVVDTGNNSSGNMLFAVKRGVSVLVFGSVFGYLYGCSNVAPGTYASMKACSVKFLKSIPLTHFVASKEICRPSATFTVPSRPLLSNFYIFLIL